MTLSWRMESEGVMFRLDFELKSFLVISMAALLVAAQFGWHAWRASTRQADTFAAIAATVDTELAPTRRHHPELKLL